MKKDYYDRAIGLIPLQSNDSNQFPSICIRLRTTQTSVQKTVHPKTIRIQM